LFALGNHEDDVGRNLGPWQPESCSQQNLPYQINQELAGHSVRNATVVFSKNTGWPTGVYVDNKAIWEDPRIPHPAPDTVPLYNTKCYAD